MIFTVISILIALYGIFDFKKSIMLFTVYQIFWYPTVIFSIAGISFGTNSVIPLYYFLLFIINNKKIVKTKVSFPFKLPFILIILSLILSSFTALSGFSTEFSRALMRIFSVYIYIMILWYTIESEEDFKFIFKYATVVMLIAGFYSIFEYLTQSNLLLDYKVLLSDGSIELYDSSGLRGYRVVSLFEHPLGAGMTIGLYATFVLSLILRRSGKVINYNTGMMTVILLIPIVILTKMRTAIIFTLISLFTVFKFSRKIKRNHLAIILSFTVILLPILFFVISSNSSLITNLFTSEKSAEIGGSSLEMRLNQFSAILVIMKSSPILGLGETFRNAIVSNSITNAALGYEGLIFEQLTMHGVLGMISSIILMYYMILKVPSQFGSREVRVYSIAYWFSYLVSSIPSFRISLFFVILFYYIKSTESYEVKNIR
ncbi:O-antigen ligase family protein [Streptococcus gallolyticus]|uniref:O-antigen ligase family protein n=1 Tax=Streptococcus gallolyticus TaxID=315405 RepID=UPI001F445942|nr:O-antigen ligase family protein [Streptococcus gallolyticus]MCF1633480.1 O-antigen ligase family protein [Streptococcus gallolyticus]MCF2567196.1 O-antigen ligase family protein [Streptococcus pasteurianus]MCY7187480.1 O-antigen ligase family protein [Streptococcus gallolyticus subsp. gallolyticus]